MSSAPEGGTTRLLTRNDTFESIDGALVDVSWWERNRRWILGTIGVVAFLGLWQAASSFSWIDPTFVPAPTTVASAFKHLAGNGQLATDTWVSTKEFVIGMGLAIVGGIGIGLALSESRLLDELFDPLLSAFYAMPRIVLLPVLMLIFGVGTSSTIAVVVLSAFFPIMINFMAGLRSAERDMTLVNMARGFRATRRQLLLTVRLPSSVPFLISGLRLAVGVGLVGVVVGELYSGNAGLGYLIGVGGTTLQMANAFVGIVIVSVAGLILMLALRWLERRLSKWRP